jgi:glutamyl-tRNA reductase
MSLDACIAQPPTIDAIVSATASSQPVFDGAFLDRLQARTHPIICIDLAVPRDFSPEFSYNSKVSFIDIPSLKSLGEANLRQKFVEANRANDIVRESVNQYVANQCEAKLRPIFRVSYQESLRFAHESLNHLFDRSLASLSHDERETLVRLVNRLVSHSSFHPVKHLSAHLTGIQVDINAFVSDRAAKAAEA